MSPGLAIADPVTSALGYITDPFGRGAATQALTLGAAVAGVAPVEGYSFQVFQTRYGVQTSSIQVSYALTLTAPLGEGPVLLEIAYTSDAGSGVAELLVPAGTLPGVSFVLPLPRDQGLVVLDALTERPAPAPGAASGGDKWRLTAMLGNTARLLSLLLGERQVIDATARDVAEQRHLASARAGSLDLIGEDLGVPRLLPSPYRVDLDPDLIALFHLDEMVAPVLDATHEHPGVNHGAQRGAAGRIGQGVGVFGAGGLTIPDAPEFTIPAGGSFCVEMFVLLRTVGKAGSTLAVKRSVASGDNVPGWSLRLENAQQGAAVRFSLTDELGQIVDVVTAGGVAAGGWVHVAGVVDGAAGEVKVYLNGAQVATGSAKLAAVNTCADIGLGADRTGAALMEGLLDEVRFSKIARSDFSAVIGGAPYAVDADTIALYHLDETDDWVDEDRGEHYGLNHGAQRGVPARFAGGARFSGGALPEAHSASELTFQRLLRAGKWDRSQGGAVVSAGPYARYGYRQGAISLPGLDAAPRPVLVNDSPAIDPQNRGLVTTAPYGFVPADLAQTIAALQAVGRSAQEAIDYYGDWNGEPESFFQTEYAANGVTAPHLSCLPDFAAAQWIQIPASPEFALDTATGLTVEVIVKPDAMTDAFPRAIVASRSSGLREGEPPSTEAGWALATGTYNGVANAMRWVVGDAAGTEVAIDIGVSVADGRFHHIAGVVDRDTATALLFLDGVEVGRAALGTLGACTAAGDIVMGNDPALDAPYSGVLDEVRISRAARRRFNPVLGESDERYRQRLAIYRPYRLPNVDTLSRGVAALSLPALATAEDVAAEATGLLLGDDAPSSGGQLTVLETDSVRFCATRAFRIVPSRLSPGDRIAADGTMAADEAAATGADTFQQAALVREPDAPGLSFAAEGARWMTLRAARGLEALALRLLALVPTAQMVVQAGWDASRPGLHAEGRALDIALTGAPAPFDLGVLAALAHSVGVDYVAYDSLGATVELGFKAGGQLDVVAPPLVAPGASVQIVVTRPAAPSGAVFDFRVVRCGAGNGRLAPDPAAGPTARLFTGLALGAVTIAVQCFLAGGVVLAGACKITIAPDTLGPCDILGGDGTENVTEQAASGSPDGDFQAAYLVACQSPVVDFAAPAARQMQLPLETALLSLAALAAAEPGAPRITVLASYDPSAATLQSVGRGLVVAPTGATLTAARLGALAWQAGFSYIEMRRYPNAVYVSVPAGQRFEIARSPIKRLWPNARISGQGQLMAREFDAAGPPDPGFTAAMLVTFTGAGVVFAAGVSQQMQTSLAAALAALTAALSADGVGGNVQVAAGFDPTTSDLSSVGRALLMRHDTVPPDRLAGYALQAGFAFVQHRAGAPGGAAVYAAAYPASGAPLDVTGDGDLVLGALAELSLRPNLALSGSFDWCLLPCCGAAATLSTALRDAPAAAPGAVDKVLHGKATGTVTVDAAFSLDDAAEPYEAVIVPVASGDGVEPRLTKDQYDDLLNFLDAYHPVGVQVETRGVRRFVHGFRAPPGWSQLPTDATFPTYRNGR